MTVRDQRLCAYCGEKFTPAHNPDQQYCSSQHLQAAYKERRLQDRLRASWDVNLVGRCPKPHKIGYSSYEQASLSAWADTNWIYRCVCGAPTTALTAR